MFKGQTFSLQRMSNYSIQNNELNNNPQRTLKIKAVDVDGFLGYAVNFIHLDETQLSRDLRRRFWYK
jgi:hypothetical protein